VSIGKSEAVEERSAIVYTLVENCAAAPSV
jgi:hypothetical protein